MEFGVLIPCSLCYPHKVTTVTIINPMNTVNCWPGRLHAIHPPLFKLSGKLALPKSEWGNYLSRLRTPISNSSPWPVPRHPENSCGYIFRLFYFFFWFWHNVSSSSCYKKILIDRHDFKVLNVPFLCSKVKNLGHILPSSHKSYSAFHISL